MKKCKYKSFSLIIIFVLAFAMFSGFTYCPYCSVICDDCAGTGSVNHCINMSDYIGEKTSYSYMEDGFLIEGEGNICLDVTGSYVCKLCWSVNVPDVSAITFHSSETTGDLEYFVYTCPDCGLSHAISVSDITYDGYSFDYDDENLTAVFMHCDDFSPAYGCQAADCSICDGNGYSPCHHPTIDFGDSDDDVNTTPAPTTTPDPTVSPTVPPVDTDSSVTDSFIDSAIVWVEDNTTMAILGGCVIAGMLLLIIRKLT